MDCTRLDKLVDSFLHGICCHSELSTHLLIGCSAIFSKRSQDTDVNRVQLEHLIHGCKSQYANKSSLEYHYLGITNPDLMELLYRRSIMVYWSVGNIKPRVMITSVYLSHKKTLTNCVKGGPVLFRSTHLSLDRREQVFRGIYRLDSKAVPFYQLGMSF